MNDYNLWLANDLLNISLSTAGNQFKAENDGGHADINKGFSSTLEQLLANVDSDENNMRMALSIECPTLNTEQKILQRITSSLSDQLDMGFVYGSWNDDYKNKTFYLSFSAVNIPSLQTLMQHTEYDLLKSIEKHSKILVSTGRFEELDTWTVVNAMTIYKTFNELPPLIAHALIYSIMDYVHDIKLFQLS